MATKITGLHLYTWSIQHTLSLQFYIEISRSKSRKSGIRGRSSTQRCYIGSLGHAVGEYVGGGQGDLEPEWTEDPDDDDAEISGDASDASCSSMTVRQLVPAL